MGGLADLLMNMREARGELLAQKDTGKAEQKNNEEEKERICAEIVVTVNSRHRTIDYDPGDDENDEGNLNQQSLKRCRFGEYIGGIHSRIDLFKDNMKEGDLPHVDLAKKRLEFHSKRYQSDYQDRIRECKELRKQREDDRHERRKQCADERRERRE